MSLWLTPGQAQEIAGYAHAAAPYEACGLLLGREREIFEIVPIRNVDSQPEQGFIAAPEILAAVLIRAQREGLELAAIYHSHPTAPPIPSARDIREAYYADALQLIVGLSGASPDFAAWRIQSQRVSRAELLIQSDRPIFAAEPRLRPSQRLAVIVAGLLAVAIVLAVALALLPPPELPT